MLAVNSLNECSARRVLCNMHLLSYSAKIKTITTAPTTLDNVTELDLVLWFAPLHTLSFLAVSFAAPAVMLMGNLLDCKLLPPCMNSLDSHVSTIVIPIGEHGSNGRLGLCAVGRDFIMCNASSCISARGCAGLRYRYCASVTCCHRCVGEVL